MIIVSIYGGIGNQMFQYALGRHLAFRSNIEVKYDYSYNLTRTDFDPSDILCIFDIFKLHGKFASRKEIQKFKSLSKKITPRKIYFYFKRRLPFITSRYTIVQESFFQFDRNIFLISDNCYLFGYWQSEKYFKNVEDLIRKEFRVKTPLNGQNLQIANEIENSESISIHMRGRDFITKEETAKLHLTCDKAYYEKSINFILKKIKRPHFFIFSDDPEWAKKILKISYPCTFVDENSWNKTSFEDMRLMSLCKHNIIANSSFSWWAAWLNQNSEKLVIAPLKWFNDSSKNTNDLIPSSWIRM